MSTITSKQSKASALVNVQAVMAGTEKHFPNGSFTLGNATYTTASLVQAFEVLTDALTALAAAHATTRDAVTAVREPRAPRVGRRARSRSSPSKAT